MSTPPHNALEMLVDPRQAALQREGDGDVDPDGRGQVSAEMREERIVPPRTSACPCGGRTMAAADGPPGTVGAGTAA